MINKITLLLLLMLCGLAIKAQSTTDETSKIKYIDIIHCTHTDYGYTDHPIIIEDIQKGFDIALDAASATSNLPVGERFCWTAEALDVVWEWWKEASPERQEELKRLIKNGQIDISALPYNVHPFLSARQWDLISNWIPEKNWQIFNPKVGIQHDVNGFSRASAIRLLDKGVKYIWNGINDYWGGAPFLQPSGFWWKMPDGRKALVWQSLPYWYGYNLLTERDWRYVQSNASNTQFRTPRIGDILQADEKSVRKAHSVLLRKIKKMQDDGYSYDFITVSITNQWRIDNDGPFPPLTDFIKKWNELKLQPKLRLTTASDAMLQIEKRVGKQLPIVEGEWPDWWAFGGASSPRGMAAARIADNYLQAALSPVWGGNGLNVLDKVDEIGKTLFRYSEHTFAANKSSSGPYSLFNQGHLAEKEIYAYRPYEQAKWLIAQRMRNLFTNQPEGLYVVNAGNSDYSGWIELDKYSFRGVDYKSFQNKETGNAGNLFKKGRNFRFWVNGLKANSYQRFILSEDSLIISNNPKLPQIATDKNGWPISVQWDEMEQPLFQGDIGKFLSLESTVGRSIEPTVWNEKDSLKRMENVANVTKQLYGKTDQETIVEETPNSIVYSQNFKHPRLKDARREIEIYKDEPRVSLTVCFNRLSSPNPETFYIEFPLPETNTFPFTSNGGEGFRPYIDQIPGTCTDFFTIDGWITYPDENGSWLWSSKEAPLVSFSSPQFAAKRITPPKNMNKVLSMVYNNMWEVNFLNDCPGEMKFHFDLAWKNGKMVEEEASETAATYHLKPFIMLNPKTREDKFTFKRMNEIK